MIGTGNCRSQELWEAYLMQTFKKGLSKGLNFFNLIRCFSSNTINNYNLSVGLLRENNCADFIIVDDILKLIVLQTYINGHKVFDRK
jgi:adenine deaminase